ncbi:MAG: selenocysteine-specific translation elongation factor [Nitrospirae bacterium]|nr:selenocysteine-specific translation elongation factor [Nitrospirota bacterium]
MRYVILGTAGHIDHGKSALVKALTGIDPDRLKEEKERGITIDLGFAELSYPDGLTIGIVDVPGHERLVRNMLAGAGGIDLVLLVIAADEGIMPQSREHLHICNLLKIKSGLIIITKADLVENEWIELLKDEIKDFVRGTFLDGAKIIPVSSKTMFNIDLLKEEIRAVALNVEPKPVKGLFRLPIDRVFTLKGFGTVVTGTAVSGSISVDEPVEVLPSNIKSKVRGLHSHRKPMQTAFAGQRVAINLQGVEKEDLKRGDSVVLPGRFIPTKIIDAKVDLLQDAPPLKNKVLVHFHLATSETIARVILYGKDELRPGESCYCQYRLQEPIVSMSGDRYIIRRFSPVDTIGGGEVLDPSPPKRKQKDIVEDLKLLEKSNLTEKISFKVWQSGFHGISIKAIEGWVKTELTAIKDSIHKLKEKGIIVEIEDILIHKTFLDLFREKVLHVLKEFHSKNPLKPGMPKEELRAMLKMEPKLFTGLINSIRDVVTEKEVLRLKTFSTILSQADESMKNRIIEMLQIGRFQPPTKEELSHSLKLDHKHLSDILNHLVKEGTLVRINDSLYLTTSIYTEMINKLKDLFSKKPEMTVAEFRDILSTTRKYALPILEYLDSIKVTLRVGDVRKLLLK